MRRARTLHPGATYCSVLALPISLSSIIWRAGTGVAKGLSNVALMLFSLALAVCIPASALSAEQWAVYETSFTSTRKYANPFLEVQVDVVFRNGDQQWVVPAFWAGGDRWTVRFAPPVQGDYTFEARCSDPANRMVSRAPQPLHVTAHTGNNPLLRHGFIRVSTDRRHFEHEDGTPFLWLGDTWWKNLCERMTWEGFRQLTADRRAKGFNVVQIVCGPYPDEGFLEPRLANEGGLPYESTKFERVNPEYFDCADRRLKHLARLPQLGPESGGPVILTRRQMSVRSLHYILGDS